MDAGDRDAGDGDGSVSMDGSDRDASRDGDVSSDGATDANVDADAGDGSALLPRDRFGVYVWGFEQSGVPVGARPLAWATDLVRDLGTRVIRVTISATDPYGANPAGTFTLAAAAASDEYVALFDDAAFDTYMLTVYSTADETNPWQDGYTAEEAAAERAEIAALATHLLDAHPDKTFILFNWEGDNAISSTITPFAASSTWDAYRAWIEARASGVADARAARPASQGRVLSGLEFNFVRHTTTDAPCDGSAVHCVLTDVAPFVDVDYYSYSAYQSLLFEVADEDIDTKLSDDLDFILAAIRTERPEVTRDRIVVGEIGFAREGWGECRAANRTGEALLAARAWGVGYGIYWQIVDNADPVAGQSAQWTGYGAHRPDGSISLIGATLASFFDTGTKVVPNAFCPTTNPAGVSNSAGSASDPIYGDSTISLWGNFGASGNVVHIWHPTEGRLTITSGSSFWYESVTQINATLPGLDANESVSVFVTTDGIDTNVQYFTIAP